MKEEEEIKARFQPRELKYQAEFDMVMREINAANADHSRKYDDAIRTMRIQKEEKRKRISQLYGEIHDLNTLILNFEQKKKELNRMFYDIKGEFMHLNPAYVFIKELNSEGNGK